MPSSEKIIIYYLHKPYFKKKNSYITFTKGVFKLKVKAKRRLI